MTTEADRHMRLQTLLNLIGISRKPYIETGRKFDKVFLDGKVRYFVARQEVSGRAEEGDIFGAKSALAPNFRWFFGNLTNVEKWNWTDAQPRPVTDSSVMTGKKYGAYVHYMKIPTQTEK